MNLYIGSGDIAALMSGKNTKMYQDLLRKFVDENAPYYNAIASPIDALRTGAILEERYLLTLTDDYFTQIKVQSKEMNVFISSLDFAKINNGTIVEFDELKTISLTDYIDQIQPIIGLDKKEYTKVIKKEFKKYYNQIQAQLYCAELSKSNLVFLSVLNYNDEDNNSRIILDNEYYKFEIDRDDQVIDEIKERGRFFQYIKNHFEYGINNQP